MVDLLILNGIIVTMDQNRQVINNGGVAVKGSKIVDVGRSIELKKKYNANKVIDASGKAILPGFINCHTHTNQTILKGVIYDAPYTIFGPAVSIPALADAMPEDYYASGLLTAAEMIKSGTTCVCDMVCAHSSFDNIQKNAEAIEKSGLRYDAVWGLMDSGDTPPELWRGEESIAAARSFIKEWHEKNDGRIKVWLGQPTVFCVSLKHWNLAKQILGEFKLKYMVHIYGSIFEHISKRDTEYLHERGISGPNTVFVHCIWMSPREISLIRDTNTRVAHCPIGNSFLGYGVSPLPEMLNQGITVGLGSDGMASYTHDMFDTMRYAAFLQKANYRDGTAVTAEKILEMATIDGAKVLGRENEVGSIEVGKKADIIIIDLQKPHMHPVNRIVPTIVYTVKGNDVETTIIDGKIVMENHELKTIQEKSVLKLAREACDRILEKRRKLNSLLERPWPMTSKAFWE
ncbi:MAG: amidohydrolase family protein [Candidatus Hodarchaeota archaeon]